jgi:hypothetical protein
VSNISTVLSAGLWRAPSAVGIDTALFQSADSYFDSQAARRDPHAASCFEAVATPLCNNARLIVPVSGSTRIATPPRVIEWWAPNLEIVQSYDWRDKAAHECLAEPFSLFAENFPTQLASWISFQLSPNLRDQNFGTPEQRDLEDVESNASRLLQQQRLPRFLSALDKEAVQYRWDVPTRFSGAPHRMLLTAVAYAFSLYVRAWSYAWTLGEHASDPYYRCIWVRDSALSSNDAFSAQREQIERPEWFPWGEILTRILGDTYYDGVRLKSVVTSIRDQSDIFFRDYSAMLLDEDPRRTIVERELLVADVLQKSGATPKLKRRSQARRLLGFLRSILSSKVVQTAAGHAGPALAGAEKVISHTPVDLIDRVQGRLALQFRRDKFWEEFDRRALDPVRDWEDMVLRRKGAGS